MLNSNFEGVFYRDKRVEEVGFTSLWQNIPIHSLIFLGSMFLKGLILTITRRNVCNTDAGGGVCLKRQKMLKGLLKIGYD